MNVNCILTIIVGICLSLSDISEARSGSIDPESDVKNVFAEEEQDGLNRMSEKRENYFREFLRVLNNFDVYGKDLAKTVAKLSESITSINISRNVNLEKCRSDVMRVLQDALNSDLYALRMLDAWGRPNGGVLEGNVRWSGHYYECREAKSEEISGKWCNSYWRFENIPGLMDNKTDASLGTCFPSTCSEESVRVLLTSFFNISEKGSMLLEVTCTNPVSEFLLSTADVIGIVISAALVACVGTGTVMDGMVRLKQTSDDNKLLAHLSTKHSTFVNVMLCFSAISNGEKLVDMTRRPGTLPVLDGIRFISATWVMLHHCFVYFMFETDNRVHNNRVRRRDPLMILILNGTFSVDTFFFLSSFLVTYHGIKQLQKMKGHINIPLMYLQRYLRLTPVLAYLILFSVGLYKYIGSGPFWQENVDLHYNLCKDTWYSNLLYINNVYPAVRSCYEVSWYLACDMQFYILSPIFLLLLYKSKILGSLLILFVWIASILTTGLLTYFYGLQPPSINLAMKRSYRISESTKPQETYTYRYQHDTYFTPWCKIGAYMIGMLTGYYMYEYKGKVRMNKIVVGLGWILSAAAACTVVYGPYPYIRDNTQFSTGLATFYEFLSRPVWSLCVAWVVVACISGYGGLITTFLNWKIFTPLSRLTFSAYLTHALVYPWYLKSQESPVHFLTINLVYCYLGTLVISFGCAFVTFLFLESPIMSLMKIMFPSTKSKPLKKTLPDEVDVAVNCDHSEKTKKENQGSRGESKGDTMVLEEVALPKQIGKTVVQKRRIPNRSIK